MSTQYFAKLSIIIVNWNTGQQLKNCLESIAKAKKDNFELVKVIVVDNASSDDSISKIDGIIDFHLEIINNSENRGFAAACNQGTKNIYDDYLLFLNPDTILSEDSLLKSVAFLEKKNNENVGIVGIQLTDVKNKIQRTCARFPTSLRFINKIFGIDILLPNKGVHMNDWDHNNDSIVDHVMGAFFLVRRKLFTKLNGFDELFFVYLEDVDFSYRASQEGYSSYYLTSTSAYHKGGGSSEKVKDVRLFYSLRSKILYGYKHFNFFSATLLAFLTLIIEPVTRIIFSLIKKSIPDVMETLKAYKLLWCFVIKITLKKLGKKFK
jgi:GT2 family glycosyltransferase